MLKIGKLTISYPTVLSPMASLTDIVFRQLMDEIGHIGYMVTEMVSAEGIRRQNERTLAMLKVSVSGTPQFVQLFGTRPESFSEAVRHIRDETGFSGIDINLGCPVRKITRRGAGAALLKNLPLVKIILRTVRNAISLPMTIKIRLPDDPEAIPEMIRVIEGEGIDAITVHFRRISDRYSDPARWDLAGIFRENIRSIFIGNGDIRTVPDALSRLKMVDAVMIGREALRDPLIFLRIYQKLTHDCRDEDHLRWNFEGTMKRLMELIQVHYTPEFWLRRLKAYIRFLVSGKTHSKKLRDTVYQSTTFHEACEAMNRFYRLDSNKNPS